MTSRGHVFISHGSENRPEAQDLCAFLEGRGIRVWIAPRDVRPGMDYSEQLQLAIEQCSAFAVLVTEKANKSPYVRAETEMAFSTHKPIFPIRMSDIAPAAGLALFLKIRHWTDAFGTERDANLERLGRELEALAGGGETSGGSATSGDAVKAEATAPPVPPAPPPSPAPPPPPAPAPTPAPAPAPPPPPPPAPPAPPPSEPMDEERLRAAIGSNADYYLPKWNEMRAKGSKVSWNWAACFANMFWFAWRRMWLPLGLLVGAFLLLDVIAMASPGLGMITLLASIGLTFATGAFGNYLYRRQTEALVATTAGLDREAALASLKRRGGTSRTALFVTIGVVVLLVILATAGQMAEIQREIEDREARERVDALFNEAGGSEAPQDETVVDGGDKPIADDEYYYPEGE